MATRVFNDADRFLIERWQEAKKLADSMGTVREKYWATLREIGEDVCRLHKNLDAFNDYFTQGWATGNLVFGRSRKTWAAAESDYDPNGLWLGNLHLDYLTSEEEEPPAACVWVKASRKAGVDVVAAKNKLWEKLSQLLDSEEQKRMERDEERDILISWNFSSKPEIIGWLLAEEMGKLSECVHEQVAIFAKFVPVLDEVLRPASKNKTR